MRLPRLSKPRLALVLGLFAAAALVAPGCKSYPPLPTMEAVDVERFMGDWYVLAHVPVGSEEDAYNGVESYALEGESKVLTSYVFRDGSFEGDVEVMEPVGFVKDDSGARWGMRFLWPFQAEYRIAWVDEDYGETIIARTKRDYAWIMARTPDIGEERLAALEARLVELGYDAAEIRRVPQRWPDEGHPLSASEGNLARYTRQ